MTKTLVADDDRNIREMLCEVLECWGYVPIPAADGREALELLTGDDPPLLAILDWVMPELPGIDVIARVRAANRLPRSYILVLTGRSDPQDIVTGLDAGADDFISKPVHLAELRSRLGVGMRMVQAETELLTGQRRLAELNQQLRASQQQLVHQEKLATIGQIAAGIAHEVNNPIGFVMSNLGTIGEYVDSLKQLYDVHCRLLTAIDAGDRAAELVAEARELARGEDLDFVFADLAAVVTESREGALRVRDIVRNLKNFARSDGDEWQEADLNEAIESTLKMCHNELKYKCTVHRRLGDLPPIACRVGQLNQVFMNLLINAAKAIPDQGEITVATSRENDTIRIRVEDTGEGIPPANMDRLFEPFFTTRKAGEGTGLGLAICAKIVRDHAGTIDVESEVGKGTAFTVTLPIKTLT